MPRVRQRKMRAGFAIGTYDQRMLEDAVLEVFGPNAEPDERKEALKQGLISRAGEITERGWESLSEDIMTVERNALAWLRRHFKSVRDEGHTTNDDLVGSVWYDSTDKVSAKLVHEFHQPETMQLTDITELCDGTGLFGVVIGGWLEFYDVSPDT